MNKLVIIQEVDARKQTMPVEEAWKVASMCGKVLIASGKKIEEIVIEGCEKAEVLPKMIGRSGNLRAPALRVGDILYVGFNDALYEQLAAQ